MTGSVSYGLNTGGTSKPLQRPPRQHFGLAADLRVVAGKKDYVSALELGRTLRFKFSGNHVCFYANLKANFNFCIKN